MFSIEQVQQVQFVYDREETITITYTLATYRVKRNTQKIKNSSQDVKMKMLETIAEKLCQDCLRTCCWT